MNKVKDIDLYKLLEVSFDSEEAAIRKAYRKKALKCHPDKNPDDPKAAELFHQLTEALAVLTDVEARKAYDNVLKARQAVQIRNQQLDAKRQKLKEDLEERERAAKEREFVYRQKTDEEKLEKEIERLRKEGKRQLEEEEERIRKLIEDERSKPAATVANVTGPSKIKVRWSGGSYDKETLRRIFSKFGDVLEVVVLGGKKSGGGSGLVEMSSRQSAVDAVNIERGFAESPLKIKLLESEEKKASSSNFVASSQTSSDPFVSDPFNGFETWIMRRLRQEEERKRLIAEMMKQDAENDD